MSSENSGKDDGLRIGYEYIHIHMSSETRPDQLRKVMAEGLEWFCQKNKDYGDAFADCGPVGVLVRMQDKLRRLQSISKNGIVLVNSESMRDTLIDLMNYAGMAVMLLDEKED